MMQVSNQGLNTTGRLLNVATQLDAEVAQMGMRQSDLARRVSQLENRRAQRQRTNLGNGAVR
jgi:hypothetical protein